MRCNKCGTENPKGKSVCLKCGNFLYAHYPNNRVTLTRKQKRAQRRARLKGTSLGCLWIMLAILGMFIVLAIITYVLVAFVIPEDFFTGTTSDSVPSVTTVASDASTITTSETVFQTTIASD